MDRRNGRGYFDLHCDTLLELELKGKTLQNAQGHISVDKLRRGGAMAQCFAIFVLTHGEAEEHGVQGSPFDYFERLAARFDRELAENRDSLRQALCAEDIEKNYAEGLVSAVLTVEDAVLLEGRAERIQTLYDRGVRMMSLTWNYENSLGFPNSDDRAANALPLKPFGREAVEYMDELGMVVDVSHLSEGGFWDVAGQMKKPFAASHSCARALCDHSRNLTDEQLRALGDHGGVCGVNFYSHFLRAASERSTLEDIIRHMRYIADKAGLDAVALGSDFDGIDCELELGDCGGMPKLIEAMSREFTEAETEKICCLNAMRVFKEICGGKA